MRTTFVSDPVSNLQNTVDTVAGTEGTDGLVLLATPGIEEKIDLDSMLSTVDVPVFGGIFPELIYEGTKREDGAVVIGLATEPRVSTVPELSDADRAYEEHLNGSLQDDGYETAFVFVDAYATEIERFTEGLFRTYGVGFNFIGGGAGTLDMEQGPCLFTNEGLVEDAAVVAALEVPSTVGVKHGWQEVAGPFRVTDASGPRLETLDGQPAFDVYREVIREQSSQSIDEENFFEIAKSHPFGISRLDAEKIVRDPFEVNEDGSLSCFGDVPEGEFVHILQGDRDTLVDAAREASEEAQTSAADALIFFDCISRVLYLEEEFDRELSAVADEALPMVGALTIGEIANDGKGHLDYYNKTAVVGTTAEL